MDYLHRLDGLDGADGLPSWTGSTAWMDGLDAVPWMDWIDRLDPVPGCIARMDWMDCFDGVEGLPGYKLCAPTAAASGGSNLFVDGPPLLNKMCFCKTCMFFVNSGDTFMICGCLEAL